MNSGLSDNEDLHVTTSVNARGYATSSQPAWAAINFANGMKSGLDWMVENKRYFFPEDFDVTVEELQAWFEASDGSILGGTEIFAAASVEAVSLFECLADAGLALAEAVAL